MRSARNFYTISHLVNGCQHASPLILLEETSQFPQLSGGFMPIKVVKRYLPAFGYYVDMKRQGTLWWHHDHN
ncbi:hypothetical protein E4T39_04465 [Aureobasidium subglaciale]|nr:hypothetical protein E4T39_04465 [Aureobasidium subglaciale]